MTMAGMGSGRYLGGLPDQYREIRGRVWATEDGIGVGETGPTDLLIPLADVRSVAIETVAIAKSKVPAAVAFGVVGALAARGSEDKVAVTVSLHDGSTGYFRLDVLGLPFVQSLVGPWLREHGLDGIVDRPDLVGQIERLAQLHDTGALTEAEFSAAKGKLLGI